MRWYALLLFVIGCSEESLTRPGCVPRAHFENQTHYNIEARVLQNGLAVDATDASIPAIEEIVFQVEQCLAPYVRTGIPEGSAGWCPSAYLGLERRCLTIAVRPSILSCDGHSQLLPDLADPRSCLAKGVTPTADCLCHWREGIQDEQTAVCTPDLSVLKDPIVRIATGCAYPWNVPALTECMRATP